MSRRVETGGLPWGDLGRSAHLRYSDDPTNPQFATGVAEGLDIKIPTYPRTREEWADLKPVIGRYDDGTVSGERLIINGFSVMEEWERPIEERTMRELFSQIPVYNPTILIGGEGLGYATRSAMEEARDRGGANIIVVELNKKIVEMGEQKVEAIKSTWSPEERERVNVKFIQGDFKDVIEGLEPDSIDAARVDLYPLSPDEKDVDSFIHMRRLIRVLKPWGIVAPFIGHEDEPTEQQLSYMKTPANGKEPRELFTKRVYTSVWVTPRNDCDYFTGNRMAIGLWSGPVKTIFEPAT